jgi:glycosyltransferase involved in cell wall biosynthesis
MTEEQAARFEIDVVGETWEGWTAPAQAIAESRHRDRIRFENRYVTDSEAADYFAEADVLVLPYRRGSASGPLQIAMNNGIFVVLYAVGGLVEAVRDYPGAILIAPGDVDGLRRALLSIVDRRVERFADPHTWSPVVRAVESMIETSR